MLRRPRTRIAWTLALGLLWLPPTTAGASTQIDVLVVYPQPADDHLAKLITWGRNHGETEMGAFLDADFALVTEIYQRSGVDVVFEVVHHQAIDLAYIDAANWQVTLSLALMNSELGTAVYEPYLEAIETLRDLNAADIVVYWRDFGDGGPSSNGAGSIGGGEDEAYVQLTYGGVNPPIVAHEVGHLLGGQHSDGVQTSAIFSIGGDDATLREYRSVMTIAVPLGLDDYRYLWQFSSDGASVSGDVDCSPLSSNVQVCGFAEAVPLGDAEHDTVAVLSAMAPTVAAFRSAESEAIPAASVPVRGLVGLMLAALGARTLRHRRPSSRR